MTDTNEKQTPMETWRPRGVDHIGLTVPNVEEASSFLGRAFGAEVVYDVVSNDTPALAGRENEDQSGMPAGSKCPHIRLIRISNGPQSESSSLSTLHSRDRPCSTISAGRTFAVTSMTSRNPQNALNMPVATTEPTTPHWRHRRGSSEPKRLWTFTLGWSDRDVQLSRRHSVSRAWKDPIDTVTVIEFLPTIFVKPYFPRIREEKSRSIFNSHLHSVRA